MPDTRIASAFCFLLKITWFPYMATGWALSVRINREPGIIQVKAGLCANPDQWQYSSVSVSLPR
jgi:hypothetical protein